MTETAELRASDGQKGDQLGASVVYTFLDAMNEVNRAGMVFVRPRGVGDHVEEIRDRGLVGDSGINEGLRCVSCAYLQMLKCHPCVCKLFGIGLPSNSPPSDQQVAAVVSSTTASTFCQLGVVEVIGVSHKF
jgi:hypothetical protein